MSLLSFDWLVWRQTKVEIHAGERSRFDKAAIAARRYVRYQATRTAASIGGGSRAERTAGSTAGMSKVAPAGHTARYKVEMRRDLTSSPTVCTQHRYEAANEPISLQ